MRMAPFETAMRRTLQVIVLAAAMLPATSSGLDYDRAPYADPVFEAIHQGDREPVLEALKQGYDANMEGIPGHTAVSYAAQCRRLHILKDLVEHGGVVNLHAVRSARAECPLDIAWDHQERGEPLADTFGYLFWEQSYYLRLISIPVILLAGLLGTIAYLKHRSKKKAV